MNLITEIIFIFVTYSTDFVFESRYSICGKIKILDQVLFLIDPFCKIFPRPVPLFAFHRFHKGGL